MGKPRGKTSRDGYKRVVDNHMRFFGDIDYEKRKIRLNKSKKKNKKPGEILNTIVHEEMHRRHPSMHEKTIKKETKRQLAKMSKRQKEKYYSKYNKKPVRTAKSVSKNNRKKAKQVKLWMQRVGRSIERRGTEGSLRKIATKAGALGKNGIIKLSWLRAQAKRSDTVGRKARLALAYRSSKG